MVQKFENCHIQNVSPHARAHHLRRPSKNDAVTKMAWDDKFAPRVCDDEGNGEPRPVAVSYTHLDVYKRQH